MAIPMQLDSAEQADLIQARQMTGRGADAFRLPRSISCPDTRTETGVQEDSNICRMQPALLSALRYIRIPGLPLPPDYVPCSEFAVVEELRRIVAGLELDHTVFRANHTSNPLPLSGRFPADREKLLLQLDNELASGRLDRVGPGSEPSPFML